MYIYTAADTSPYRVFKTSAALTGGAFTAVTLGENGVKTSSTGDVPVGILAGETQENCPASEEVNVVVMGSTLWVISEQVSAGDFLAVGDNGLAVKAGADAKIFAQALEGGAANQAVKILITR